MVADCDVSRIDSRPSQVQEGDALSRSESVGNGGGLGLLGVLLIVIVPRVVAAVEAWAAVAPGSHGVDSVRAGGELLQVAIIFGLVGGWSKLSVFMDRIIAVM